MIFICAPTRSNLTLCIFNMDAMLSLLGILFLRWGFLIWVLIFIADFFPHLGSFLLFFSLRFGQVSPLAIFKWLTATSEVKLGRNVVRKRTKNYQYEEKNLQ